MSKETGGPAFPYEYDHLNNDGSCSREIEPGQTLRDHFAGLAMQALLTLSQRFDAASEEDLYDCAKAYYRMADAMLKVRGE